MCLCIYVCACVYLYICIYVDICVFAHVSIYLYFYISLSISISIYLFIYIYILYIIMKQWLLIVQLKTVLKCDTAGFTFLFSSEKREKLKHLKLVAVHLGAVFTCTSNHYCFFIKKNTLQTLLLCFTFIHLFDTIYSKFTLWPWLREEFFSNMFLGIFKNFNTCNLFQKRLVRGRKLLINLSVDY